MSYQKTLIEEINSVLNQLSDEQKLWNAKMIANEVCENHKDELKEGAEFSRYNCYSNVRSEVRNVINKRAGDRPMNPDPQMVIEGMKYVQSYYMVDREGEQVGVSIHKMTSEEIHKKAELYRKMGDACHAHADELINFHEKFVPQN